MHPQLVNRCNKTKVNSEIFLKKEKKRCFFAKNMVETIFINKHILHNFFIQGKIMKTYDLIDHTADVGLKAYGKNLSEGSQTFVRLLQRWQF